MHSYGLAIIKDAVRRMLMKYYLPTLGDNSDPSWRSFIDDMKDSLWSIICFTVNRFISKFISFTRIPYPYIERVIGTIRRESLAQALFWNEVDLQNKLNDFTDYDNNHRVHSSLNGEETLQSVAKIENCN